MQIETYLCKTCFIMHDTRNTIQTGENEYQCKICYEAEKTAPVVEATEAVQ